MTARSDDDITAIPRSVEYSVLDRLYEAALDCASWGPFLDGLADLLSCHGAQYLAWDGARSRLICSVFSGECGEDIGRRWGDYGPVHDPRLRPPPVQDAGQWLSFRLALHASTSMECFYRDFLEPQGIRHMVTLYGDTDDDLVSALTLFCGGDQPLVGEEESACLERLRPHILRAMRLHTGRHQVQRRSAVLEHAFDVLDYPMLVLEDYGRLTFRNRAARSWLACNEHFFLNNRCLTGRNSDCHTRLRQALRDHHQTIIPLRCPAGCKPWQMVVWPIRPTDGESGQSLVIIADPKAQASLRTEDLQCLFGITAAGARVAIGLAEGKTLQEIAEENGVSINTIRSQFRQVMDRTGSHRQVELVSVVSALPRLRR